VHNCSEDVIAIAFIIGLRVTYPLYKHLVKYNITPWSEVLYRAKPYIQLEEAMKSSANQSLNRSDDGERTKPHHRSPSIDNPVASKVLSRSVCSRTLSRIHSDLTE